MNRPGPSDAAPDNPSMKHGQPPQQLNIETLRQWQSDLEGFVAQIRKRLKTLSQSMKNHRLTRRSKDQQAAAAQAVATPVEAATVAHPPAASQQQPPARPASFESHGSPNSGHQMPGNPPGRPQQNTEPPISEDDPLAQLDAIKRRLAEQLENT